MTRYDETQIGDDAVQASSFALTIRGPRALARLWAVESRTLAPRYAGLERAPKDHPWFEQARKFLEICQADRVDPARVVACLFDYARVQKRRGRTWRPSLPSARSEFARRLYDEWEARQRSVSAGNPGARSEAARRLAETRREAARRGTAAPPEKSRPGPTSALSEAVRRKVVVPKNLSKDPKRTATVLVDMLRRDAATFLERAERHPELAPDAVVELDPLPYSPTFRRLVDCPLAGDRGNPLASHVLASDVLTGLARRWLVERGVPGELFV